MSESDNVGCQLSSSGISHCYCREILEYISARHRGSMDNGKWSVYHGDRTDRHGYWALAAAWPLTDASHVVRVTHGCVSG